MSEEYREAWTERLWPEGLAKYKPLGELPRIDFAPSDSDPIDRFLALLNAMPTQEEFQSIFMPDPIPLSEREPEEDDYEDHNGESWFWAGRQTAIGWRWMPDGSPLGAMSDGFTHWLPASTKYLPAKVD